jgi:hypothetical protein
MIRSALLVSTCVVAIAVSGCTTSSTSEASSESSSDSSDSSSHSSSDSSSPEAAYERDVAYATRTWALGGTDVAALQRDITRLAGENGISDWENVEETWKGVGRGLKRAGAVGDRFTTTSTQIAANDSQRLAWIKSGYEDE